MLAGSETNTNLINNAFLCFVENPDQLARLKSAPDLLPSAIEEVLRDRSPLHWMFRVTGRDVPMHGQMIPAGKVVLAIDFLQLARSSNGCPLDGTKYWPEVPILQIKSL